MNIEKAIISATEDLKAEDVFWIRQRHGERITRDYQEKVIHLLRVIVSEGKDPIEQSFKKEISMIYRQQLRREGSGFKTARLYADVHLRLIENLFERIKLELDIQDRSLLIGVYGGIGSGAIGFTSDIDCIFLYDGEKREEYDKLRKVLKNEFERISGIEVDESFLPAHIKYFFLASYEGEGFVSFDDLLDYVGYIDEMREQTGSRFLEPQFFHYPWAFSIRFIGRKDDRERLKERMKERLLSGKKKRGYSSVKFYILGEKRLGIKKDYEQYLLGKYFPTQLEFFNTKRLEVLYRKRDYEKFIESIVPYEAIKYIFRRGVFPLLHILESRRYPTDMGLLSKRYGHILTAIDFMLKAFNVRKTLFIMGQWDLKYFLYIMNFKNAREFCKGYLGYQREIKAFVEKLVG